MEDKTYLELLLMDVRDLKQVERVVQRDLQFIRGLILLAESHSEQPCPRRLDASQGLELEG
jgi:hypothetical protein